MYMQVDADQTQPSCIYELKGEIWGLSKKHRRQDLRCLKDRTSGAHDHKIIEISCSVSCDIVKSLAKPYIVCTT